MAPKVAPTPTSTGSGSALDTLDNAMYFASLVPVAGEAADAILAVRRGIDGAQRWKAGDRVGAVLSYTQSLAWTGATLCPEIPGLEQALDGVGLGARGLQYVWDLKNKLLPDEPKVAAETPGPKSTKSWMSNAFAKGKSGEDVPLSPQLAMAA